MSHGLQSGLERPVVGEQLAAGGAHYLHFKHSSAQFIASGKTVGGCELVEQAVEERSVLFDEGALSLEVGLGLMARLGGFALAHLVPCIIQAVKQWIFFRCVYLRMLPKVALSTKFRRWVAIFCCPEFEEVVLGRHRAVSDICISRNIPVWIKQL